MGKFYVQSGSLRTVVQAESGRNAAIWAVHQAMRQVLPLSDGINLRGGCGESHGESAAPPTAVLAGTLRISERGFDRDDASVRPTLEVVTEWNEMVTTLDRLERMLYRGSSEDFGSAGESERPRPVSG